MTLPPKRSKANLNSTCIWGYQSKAGAANRGGETHFNPNSSLIIRTMFSPFLFPSFFSSLVQFSRHHNHSKDVWIQMSSGRSLIKRTSTFWTLLGLNSQIDAFILLIFSSWITMLDGYGGVLKLANDVCRIHKDESRDWRVAPHINTLKLTLWHVGVNPTNNHKGTLYSV